MKKSVVVFFLLMSTFLNAEDKTTSTANAPAPPPPPVAKSVHTENDINGGKLVDDEPPPQIQPFPSETGTPYSDLLDTEMLLKFPA